MEMVTTEENTRNDVNNGGSIKLFGVNISSSSPISPPEVTELRKTLSLDNLDSFLGDGGNSSGDDLIAAVEDSGYHSDGGQIHHSQKEKNKGKPWTEEEHRFFLMGLNKYGKGDWKRISRNCVKSRTPTQVASHAQKYFLRVNSDFKRKKRPSVFDMSLQDQKDKEMNSQDASTSLSPTVQPQTGNQEPVQGQTQIEMGNRFQNLSMDYMPVYQTVPPYYNRPPVVFYPVYYTNPEPVRFVHPSGIPVPRPISIGTPHPQPQGQGQGQAQAQGLNRELFM